MTIHPRIAHCNGWPTNNASYRRATFARERARLRAVDPAGNIVFPTPLTSFVGRVADLAALEATLEASRWVAIVGPPGVGKTRLTNEMIRAMIDRDSAPPGGVWCVDLSGAKTASDATATIATVLGVAADDRGTLAERIAVVLCGRGPMLVVLHEADAFGAELPALITSLLAGAANLHVAVTSRSRTAAIGETCFDVRPLAIDDAVRLFAERASAAQRGWPSSSCAEDVARLVDALDRLPLAIELAAARVRVMTAAQLIDRPGLLFGEAGRDRLRVAFDAAWEGLTDCQRAALVQLTVFRGGFDLDAATRVVDLERCGSPAIVDVLSSLCDASLVVAQPTDDKIRFEVLALVREYLRAYPSDAGAFARHARYLLELAPALVGQLDGPDAQRARHRLLVERANLLAVVERGRDTEDLDARAHALAAAIAVATLQIRSGPYRELSDFLQTSLDRVDETRRPELCADAWWLRGEALRQAGHLDEASRCYEHVQVLGERAHDATMLGRAGYGAAAIEFSRGEFASAVKLYQARVVDLAGSPDPVILTRALSDLGVIETVLGRVDDARLAFDRALREARAGRCVIGEGRALIGLGQLEQQVGRLDDARGSFERALEIHVRVGDERSVALAHLQLALNHHLRGQLEPAAGRYRTALVISEQVGHRLLEAIVLSALGCCAHAAGRLDDARRHLQQGLVGFEQVGHVSYRAVVTARLAALLADQGDLERARTLLAVAGGLLPTAADREVTDAISLCRAHVELAAGGDPGVARGHVDVARAAAVDVRLQALVLERRLEGWTPARRRLVIGARARWFVIDNGERVGLERRGPPSRILATLVENRIAAPGAVVQPDELFEYGWPGQQISTESAAQRVYTAIWTLRKLGLRDVIVRLAEGYFIEPAIDVLQRDE